MAIVERGGTPVIPLDRRVDSGDVNRRGVIGTHDIQVGGDTRAPSKMTKAGQDFKAFFAKIGNAFLSIPTRVNNWTETRRMERAEAQEQKERQKEMPKGVTVSKTGQISGEVVSTRFPVGLKGKSGLSFEDSLKQASISELQPKQKSGVPSYMGIPIAHQAKADFFRLDMTFTEGDNKIKTRDIATKVEDDRNAETTQMLRNFAGSDKATSILSTVLTQNLSRPMLEHFRDQGGKYKAMLIEQGKIGNNFFMRDSEGGQQKVEPGGIGGMKIDVKRDESGNFQIEASWDIFLRGEGRGFDKKDFTGLDGALVKAETKFTMTIDADKANNGVLKFVERPTVTSNFSGYMNV